MKVQHFTHLDILTLLLFSMERAGIVIKTLQELQELDRQITEHKQKTTAEIHNDMFLTLTDQEEYINPYTNEVDVGSNHKLVFPFSN